ncbi:MAG: beta-N-acetylhexosaminidase [Phycisphaerae bacterium]|nr:beta-N-acetylhexosaminidase [Phycisphaerae bacterium]
MKRKSIYTLASIWLGCLLVLFSGCATIPTEYITSNEIAIIPQPQKMVVGDGQFNISAKAGISYNDAELVDCAEFLAEYVNVSNKNISSKFNPEADIVLKVNEQNDQYLGDEGYTLKISKDQVVINANSVAGVFYGVQTIRQMLPISIEQKDGIDVRAALKCVEIMDQPRYGWRGFMLDESRHFFGQEQVEKTLDMMALYKMNRFHWHLTDMNGWRIEIKKYPKLTEVGGKGDWTSGENAGGFYTQEQIKQVVEFARKRNIVIIPEIDMPGHATAANKAYPEFSGGGTDRHPEFTFNIGKEETYSYLSDILKETTELFPGPWIHFGGDEVHFANKQWKDIPEIQELMEKENLKTLYEVETYFNRRMAGVIDSLGKTTAGWDEVVDAGLDPEKTVVMWWRHNMPTQLAKALDKDFKVVLCPRIPCYFDFVQHKTHKMGRTWSGFGSLEGVYQFPDMPESYKVKDSEQIMGIQACLWTERVHNLERFDYMVYPRLSALAESCWTNQANKDWDNYQQRLKSHIQLYDVLGIGYFDAFDPEKTPEPMWPIQK